MKTEKTQQNVYSVQQYSKLVGKSRRTILRWIKDGKLVYRYAKGVNGLEYWIYPAGIQENNTDDVTGDVHGDYRHDTGHAPMTKHFEDDENVSGGQVTEKFLELIKRSERTNGKVEALEKEVEFLRSQIAKQAKSEFSRFWNNLWKVLNKRFFSN